MYIKPPKFLPKQFEGLAFALEDLRLALNWAKTQPGVRLNIKLDCICIPELLEICPPGASYPRWVIWRTYDGRLRVDDWAKGKLGLPYQTVEAALQFIASVL